jgi:glycolate oxidase FAD binding subunit
LTTPSNSPRLAPLPHRSAVVGVEAKRVLAPTSEEELSGILKEASAERSGVVVSCNASKLDFGAAPTRLDLRIELDQLTPLLAHSAGDLVVRAGASLRFDDLRAELAKAGQRLSIDEVVPGSSVGGVVATALAGPLRYRYGSVRDLILGARFVRADGRIAKAGGSVVKNVAGYDVSKLLCGSHGTLAVLTECIFRLHPIPRRSVTVSAELPAAVAASRAQAVAASDLDVAAIEYNLEGGTSTLSVLVEGSSEGAERRALEVAELLSFDISPGRAARLDPEPPSWWGSLPGDTVLKTTFAPGEAATALEQIKRVTDDAFVVRGSLGVGTVLIGVPETTSTGELVELLESLRRSFAALGGTVQLLRGTPEQSSTVDMFGPVPGLDLMARIKAQFDPLGVLGPGRFVGGW